MPLSIAARQEARLEMAARNSYLLFVQISVEDAPKTVSMSVRPSAGEG